MGDAGPVLAVDIGGTSIRAGHFSAADRPNAEARVPLRRWGWPLPVDALLGWLQEQRSLWEPAHGRVQAVGVAAAAVIDPCTGAVQVAENIGWQEVALAAQARDRLGLPVHVETDAFCGARAEGAVGAAAGEPDFLYVVVGTGIGHAVVLNGRVWRGRHGAANVFGHIKVQPGGAPCYCGGSGCLCLVASGEALAQQAAAAGESAADLTAAWIAGEPWATTLTASWIDAMAPPLANALNLLDLTTVVLGGGAIRPGWPPLDRLAQRVEALTYPQIRPVRVLQAALGDRSVLTGAAVLALRQAEERTDERTEEGGV